VTPTSGVSGRDSSTQKSECCGLYDKPTQIRGQLYPDAVKPQIPRVYGVLQMLLSFSYELGGSRIQALPVRGGDSVPPGLRPPTTFPTGTNTTMPSIRLRDGHCLLERWVSYVATFVRLVPAVGYESNALPSAEHLQQSAREASKGNLSPSQPSFVCVYEPSNPLVAQNSWGCLTVPA
jgi:hypothetical protein